MNLLTPKLTPNKSFPVTRPPRVYLAGKIRSDCWRHGLVEGLCYHLWEHGPLIQPDYIYVGPFFVSCGHGCYFRAATHGSGKGCTPDLDINQWRVAQYCRNAIREADLVFAYIESADCFGTIAELERAHCLGIPVVITFAPGIANPKINEFWFVCSLAKSVDFEISQRELPYLLRAAIEELI
jgi:hypothetical protein